MRVDGGKQRCRIAALVPKVKELAFFFRLHLQQVGIDSKKFGKGRPKLLGAQLSKINQGEIMFAQSELLDDLSSDWIGESGLINDAAENVGALRAGTPQGFLPGHAGQPRPASPPSKTFRP